MTTAFDAFRKTISRRRAKALNREDYARLIFRLIVLAAIVWLLFTQVFLIMPTSGNEMFPALKDGDLVIAFRLQNSYAKEDVVVYTVDGEDHIGRIVAKGNDVVMLDDTGSLLVNGTTQSGEIMYPTYAKEGYEYPLRVAADAVYILGDYRTQSTDSRDFGDIPLSAVKGKVITILRRRGL